MNFKLKIFGVFLLKLSLLAAQEPISIEVNKNRLVDIPFSQYVIGEPHLSINLKNDDQLLLGAMMWSNDGKKEIYSITAVSSDQGQKWDWHKFADNNSADPWTFMNANQEAVFTMLGKDMMWTYSSRDGGITWKDSVSHGPRHDHQTMVGIGSLVYLVSTQVIKQKDGKIRDAVYLAKSTDGGENFNFSTNLFPNNLYRNTMNPVILSDGTLIISFSEYAYKAADGKQNKLNRNHSWTISSSDGGSTFSEPQFITDNSRGFPVLAVDKSDLFKDRLYWVTSSDQGKNIYSFFSPSKGEGWSPANVVSDSDLIKTIPNVAVNKNGIVGITWYEKEKEKFCQNFYFAASHDGGSTFSTPVKVSDKTSCADPNKNATALRGGWSSGGHYTGLVARSDGSFQAVWADARSGIYQLYITEISVEVE